MTPTQLVDSLRATLVTSPLTDFDLAFPRAPLAAELRDRLHQLNANMIDGRVLPAPDAATLRTAVVELVRTEVLPRVEAQSLPQSIALLDLLARFDVSALEDERPRLVAARRARFPLPPPLATPEIESLRTLVATDPTVCTMAPPPTDAAFVHALAAAGFTLPEELVALYAACDGLELTYGEFLPVFCLLPSRAIDLSDAGALPRRLVPFVGGDSEQLAIYCDPRTGWRLVYEYEYQPLAEVPFELARLLRFARRRATTSADDTIFDGELGWPAFFGLA